MGRSKQEPVSTQQPQSTQYSTMKASEPQSTQKQEPEPSIHSTQQSQPQSTHNSEPEPSIHSTQHSPIEPEPSHEPQSTQQPPIHSTENKAVPRMHATFYIEFGLFDDIDAIHSIELERELNNKLSGIWIVDPAMVYDKGGNAVGVTFNAEVDINGHLDRGHPIGSVVLDKIAHLLSDNRYDSKEENVMANIIERKQEFVINEYYPMIFVCAAIGISIIFAAKLYLAQFKKKEYEPLL